MSTLRVLLSAPPAATRADEWALYDASGRLSSHGRDTPDRWPAAELREAVVVADAVRIVALALPQMSPARLAAAARFALEDRLAGPAEGHAIALTESSSGVVLARATDASLVGALGGRFDRALAEPDLAQPVSGWRWCAREGSGFVRRADGSAFACGAAPADGTLPPELSLALKQAVREKVAPDVIVADVQDAPARCPAWQAVTGVPFRAGRAWQWYAAPASAFASAADLLASAAEPRPPAPAGRIARLFVPAVVLAALALGLHVAATLGTWVAQRIEVARQEEALSAMALAAGLKNVTRDNAATALARRYASARHRAGLAAPDDAIPMLARAAPALAQLPSGTLKRATYAASIWTFELAALDDPAIDSVEQRLAAAGLPVLHARHADGVRLRVGPAP